MRRSPATLTLLLAATLACHDQSPALTCGAATAQPECRSLVYQGTLRLYLLHVPASYHAGGSLVIALHGVGQLGPRLRDISGLSDMADTIGFAVAYPNALTPAGSDIAEWNVFHSISFGEHPPDDVGFLRALITSLQRQLGADPARIYVVGLSNGGLMAHRVAAELGDKVAAVVDVAGILAEQGSLADLPTVTNPVSILMLHGDSDAVVPCCAIKSIPTLDQTFDYWAGSKGDACGVVSTTATICAGPETPSSLAGKSATSCAGGTDVQFYMLFGGRHGWYQGALDVPGEEGYNPLFNDSTGVTMNDVIWRWFDTHPRP